MGTVTIKRTDISPRAPDDYDRSLKRIKANGNTKVRRPLPRMTRDIVPRKSGPGPVKKFTPLRMVNGVNRYFGWCEEKDEVPTIKGMMIYLGLHPKTFYDYLKHPEFMEIMEMARMMIKNWMEVDVYNTPGPASGKIAYMKNTHDWSEKISTENKTEITQRMSVEEARGKLASLAPVLLELLQSDRALLEQLGKKEVVDAEYSETETGE